MAAGLSSIPEVDIDPEGVFKYVLIRVHVKSGSEDYRDIVRGYGWAEYHADIYDRVAAEIEKDEYDCECLGGGRIRHSSKDKKIHIYGYSLCRVIAGTLHWRLLALGLDSEVIKGFGRARHAVSMEKIQAKYPDYKVTWADEGY